MNNRQHKITSFLILLLLTTMPYMVLAQDDPVIEGFSPTSAPQGSIDLDVTINGQGFDKSAKVQFLIKDTEDPGGISVGRTKVTGSTRIVTRINIADLATIAEYEIVVSMSRGRSGKGTTLFSVKQADTAVPNNDGSAIPMTCTINLEADTLTTVDNDLVVNSPDGNEFYYSGQEKVHCISGGVVGDTLAGLRIGTMLGGNLRNAIRFVDLNFDPACDPTDTSCLALTSALRNRLPAAFLTPSKDTVQLDIRPYADAIGQAEGQTHIHLMTPGPYSMYLTLTPEDQSDRYLFQMSSRTSLPKNSHSCEFNAQTATGDINVYVWRDGVFTGVQDGLPDGYTVSTGVISSFSETAGGLPQVTAGFSEAFVCSNVALDDITPCEEKNQKNALCHGLGKVPMRFTMHMYYQ
jgi:hypothetical protein